MAVHLQEYDRLAVRRRQDASLRQLLSDTYRQNAFVTERLQRAGLDATHFTSLSFDELLARLPLTTKAELVADQAAHPPYGSNLTNAAEAYCRLHQTSGTTTGVPMRWLDTPQSWQWMMSCWEQLFEIAGVRQNDRLFFPFSFGPFLGFWAGFEGANRLGIFCLAGGGLTSSARLKLMLDNNITVVCATPTYALRLAETARSEGLDLLASSVRMILTAGEPGGSISSIRGRIESEWGARVCDHWGMTELGPLAIECETHPLGLHVLETECIAEILDPDSLQPATGDANGARQGELVITNLRRTGSPLIRYRTGDFVTSDPQPCPCGRPFLRLSGGIQTRLDDMLIIRGNNVFPSSVEAILRSFPEIVEYRMEVRTERSMTHMTVQLELAADSSIEVQSQTTTKVAQAIKDRLNFVPDVVLVPTGTLPRFELKGKRLVRVG